MLIYAYDTVANPVHIGEIAGLAHLPKVHCPSCASRVIPHFRGFKVTHHFKHEPGVDCVAAGGEGAWHLSAKLHLERVLGRMAINSESLKVRVQCPCPRASVQPMVDLAQGDRVVLERSIGPYRPDLVVVRGDREILRVEVLVTHACDAVKWSHLRADGVPALEIQAGAVLPEPGSDGPSWDGEAPLSFERGIGLPEAVRCEGCVAKDERIERERLEKARIAEDREREWKSRREVVLAVQSAYQHYRGGKRRKFKLALFGITQEGRIREAWLEEAGGEVLGRWTGEDLADSSKMWRELVPAVRAWAASIHRAQSRITFAVEPLPLLRCGVFMPNSPKTRNEAFKFERSRPWPELWWEAERKAWVRGYTPGRVLEILGPLAANERVVHCWVSTGRFGLLNVQACLGGKELSVCVADRVDGFRAWLTKKRAADGVQ